MAKLKLLPVAKPTFNAVTSIPVPGGAAVDLGLRYKWRTRDELKSWIESLTDKSNVQIMLEMLDGWELEDAFTEEILAKFDQEFPGACNAIYVKYLSESSGAKSGN